MIIKGRAIRAAMAAAAAALTLAASASSASASQTFGSDLTETNFSGGEVGCISGATCTVLVDAVHPGNAFPAGAPIDGVVVSFGIKTANAATVTFRLGHIGISAMGFATGTGPVANMAAAGTYSFPARLPVHVGDLVGFDYSTNFSSDNVLGDGHSYYYSPPLVDNNATGQGLAANAMSDHLVNAVVEPDADHDGYGDETQDQCPTDGSTQGPCPTATSGTSTTPSTTPTPKPQPCAGKAGLALKRCRCKQRPTKAQRKKCLAKVNAAARKD
jgi:hypothetical protein